jgi:hypothetical protein
MIAYYFGAIIVAPDKVMVSLLHRRVKLISLSGTITLRAHLIGPLARRIYFLVIFVVVLLRLLQALTRPIALMETGGLSTPPHAMLKLLLVIAG